MNKDKGEYFIVDTFANKMHFLANDLPTSTMNTADEPPIKYFFNLGGPGRAQSEAVEHLHSDCHDQSIR